MNSLYAKDPAGRAERTRPGFYSRVRVSSIGGRADATFTGYLNDPEATAAKLVGGWYRTGDSAYLHPSGDVVLTGRIDDMINSGGENVHPEEVEAVLARHPAVREAAVVGVPDPRWGEVVMGCVVAAADVTADQLDVFCRASSLANYKRPRAYLLLDELPRNAVGKILRRQLRGKAAEAPARRWAAAWAWCWPATWQSAPRAPRSCPPGWRSASPTTRAPAFTCPGSSATAARWSGC